MSSTQRIQSFRQVVAGQAAVALHTLLGSQASRTFGILMYHRIADRVPGITAPTWNVTPKRFRAQLQGLQDRQFVAWPLRKVLEYSQAGKEIPRKTFVVTFDDGYENVFSNAFPILQELQIPATVFLATAFLDTKTPFPFDDWQASGTSKVPAQAWLPLTTDQCRTMQESGLIELAAHTHTHADFRGQPELLRDDLKKSVDLLRERFGISDPTFAFPYGTKHLGFSGGCLTMAAKETDVLCSLTTESEMIDPSSDPFDWGRFTAESFDTPATLAAKLSGCYTLARDGWRHLKPVRRKMQSSSTPLALSPARETEPLVS